MNFKVYTPLKHTAASNTSGYLSRKLREWNAPGAAAGSHKTVIMSAMSYIRYEFLKKIFFERIMTGNAIMMADSSIQPAVFIQTVNGKYLYGARIDKGTAYINHTEIFIFMK